MNTMRSQSKTTPTVQDLAVTHPAGRLFARSWTPAEPVRGCPVVLMHDSLGCVDLWRDFPSALAAETGRRVIAYDRLGFGQSDPRDGRPPVGFVAQEASEFFPAVREQLALERFVMLGHSVGGGMSIECAAAHREGCEALVTVAAQVFAEDRTLDGIRAAQAQFQDPAQVLRLARYHGPRAEWVLDAWIGNWLDPAFADWSLVDVLPRIACPTLAIHGENDEYGSTVHPTLIGRHVGGAVQVEVLPDTGHVPHRERPETVLALVRGFLDRLDFRSGAPSPVP